MSVNPPVAPAGTPGPAEPLPAAVLWDMDGTLVDTEPYWIAEEMALAGAHSGVWTHEDGLGLVGRSLLDSAGILIDRLGLPMSPQAVVEVLIEGVARRVARHPPWRPGVLALMAECRALGVPQALVTMSWTRLADEVVAALPPGAFATVVTGDQVTHGKPHPEPYLTAAARLGVDPSRCVAIEDSPPGLASAGAAGCRVIGVLGHVPLAAAPGLSRMASLDGVRAATLAAIAAGRVIDSLEVPPL